jgi:hypothetical protein
MDVIGGLTSAKLALDLAKDLREIDRSVDEAAYKLKLADLTSALADTQLALADAKIRISDLEAELADRAKGMLCPICRSGRLQVDRTEPSMAGDIEFHYSSCDNPKCDYSTTRRYDQSIGQYIQSK